MRSRLRRVKPAAKRQWQIDHPSAGGGAGTVFTGGASRPPKDRTYPDWWQFPYAKSPLGIQYSCPHEPLCTVSGWADWDCGLRQLGHHL